MMIFVRRIACVVITLLSVVVYSAAAAASQETAATVMNNDIPLEVRMSINQFSGSLNCSASSPIY